MPNHDARIVRGLSIAVIVLSILAILLSLFLFLFVGLGWAGLNDPTIANSVYGELNGNSAATDALGSSGLTTDDAIGLAVLGIGALGALLVWELICSLLVLIAGIIGVRNHAKFEKLGSAFVWAIIGTIAALLSGCLIPMVLLIISAVYINKIRKGSPIPYGQPQPGYAAPYPGQPVGYGAPVYQPQQSMPQYQQQPQVAPMPQQPSAPLAPVAPQSPTPPEPPEQQ